MNRVRVRVTITVTVTVRFKVRVVVRVRFGIRVRIRIRIRFRFRVRVRVRVRIRVSLGLAHQDAHGQAAGAERRQDQAAEEQPHRPEGGRPRVAERVEAVDAAREHDDHEVHLGMG